MFTWFESRKTDAISFLEKIGQNMSSVFYQVCFSHIKLMYNPQYDYYLVSSKGQINSFSYTIFLIFSVCVYLWLLKYPAPVVLKRWSFGGCRGSLEYYVVGNHCPLVILITNYLRKAWTRPELCDKWPSFTKLEQK